MQYINMLDLETDESMRCRGCGRVNMEVDKNGLIHCPSEKCRTVHVVDYENPRTMASGRVLGYSISIQFGAD